MQKPTNLYGQIKDGIKPVGDAPAQENRGALVGSGGQTPLKLVLENIGPIKSAEIELGKTVLYGPNAAGKTFIAKSLKLMFSLLGDIRIGCDKLIEDVRYGADVGRIAFKDYVVEITRAGDYKKAGMVIKKGGEVLYSGECTGGYFSTGLNAANDVILWVGGGAVNIYGAGIDDYAITEDHLLSPYVTRFISKCGGDCAQATGDYVTYMIRVNDIIESVTNGRIEYPPGELMYFFDGEHYYYFDAVSLGIKRVAVMAGAIVLAEKMAALGKEPVVFIENIEDTLHVDYLKSILDVISTTNVPVIIETHSGFVLRYAAAKETEGWRAYVVQDGAVTSDLTKVETFKHEVDLLR